LETSELADLATSIHASAVAAGYSVGRRRLALLVVLLAFMMELLDLTIVNIAMPSLAHDLHAGSAALQWIVAGYALSFSVLLISGGRLGDILGYRLVFVIGVIGFSLASLLCGSAQSAGMLAAARIAQGALAALMVPQVMSLLQVMYAPQERLAVLGLFGAVGGVATVAGPVVGGLLLDANLLGLGWRPIFLVNVPIGLLAALAGRALLPGGASSHPGRIDLPGNVLLAVALSLVLVPLLQGPAWHWPLWCVAALVAAPLLLVGFARYCVWRMAKDGSALVVPALFASRAFTLGNLTSAISSIVVTGYLFIWTLTIQQGLGFSVLRAAMAALPFALGAAASIGLLARALLPLLGRYLVTAGAALMAVGLAGAIWSIESIAAPGVLSLAPSQLLIGLGMGCAGAPITSIALSEVAVRYAGSASGVINAVRQFAGAVGIALCGGVFFALLHRAAPLDPVSHGFRAAFAWSAGAQIGAVVVMLLVSFALPDPPRRGLRPWPS
jgi:EmrB/QacA subfamily drug resistance transporter